MNKSMKVRVACIGLEILGAGLGAVGALAGTMFDISDKVDDLKAIKVNEVPKVEVKEAY